MLESFCECETVGDQPTKSFNSNIDWNGWNKFKEGLQEDFARPDLPENQLLMCKGKKR